MHEHIDYKASFIIIFLSLSFAKFIIPIHYYYHYHVIILIIMCCGKMELQLIMFFTRC